MPLRLPLLALAFLLAAPAALAQPSDLPPRFGGGFDGLVVLGGGSLLNDGIGVGVRGRASFPMNADLSIAADAGLAGFLLGGRDDASYLFSTQVSAIVTLPALGRARYVLGGLGWYAPLGGGRASGGPALHGGLGWVTPLQDSALYLEVNPALVIGQASTALAIPVRIGVIF